VRVVDDDGQAKPGACGASKASRTSIQDAIDDSGPGDVVQICPGTYTEVLLIEPGREGLTIRAIGSGTVTLRRPGGVTDPTVQVENDETHWVGHDIRLRMRTTGDCVSVNAAVVVDGASAVVLEDIHLTVVGGGDSFACGFQSGIVVTDGGQARILRPVIEDWQQDGVSFRAGGRGRVVNGDFRWVHADVAPVTGTGITPAGGPSSRAISVFDSGRALIRGNEVEADPAAGPELQGGIIVANAGSEATIVDNVVRRASVGLFLSYDSASIARGNRVRGGDLHGIWLYEGGTADVEANRVSGFVQNGIRVESGGNAVSDNDARGNGGRDCRDLTSGDGSHGTANLWSGNRGDAKPAGICAP
jgi:nitrous oxidase accessory protein NosD